MHVTINGVVADLVDGVTVSALVPTISNRTSGIAVAHNGEVVPKAAWPDVVLREGDRLDVLTAVQGG